MVLLVHMHIISKLIFKTLFKLTHKTKARTLAVLISGLCLIIYVELFVICGLPDNLAGLLSLQCRDTFSIGVEYAIVFLFASAEFLRESTPETKKKDSK